MAAIAVGVLLGRNVKEVSAKSIDTSTDSITVKVGETEYFAYSAVLDLGKEKSFEPDLKISGGVDEGNDSCFVKYNVYASNDTNGFDLSEAINNVKGSKAECAIPADEDNKRNKDLAENTEQSLIQQSSMSFIQT